MTDAQRILWIAPLVAALLISAIDPHGALARHMIVHLVLMNALAPIAAWPFRKGQLAQASGALVAAFVAQIVLFFAWHAPPGMGLAMHSLPAQAVMQLSLFAAAVGFWAAIFAQAPARPFLAIFALLVTGKLFCLMAALWVFSPRALFHGGLADQQLAGLIMLTACPLFYIAAAIAIAVRLLYRARAAA